MENENFDLEQKPVSANKDFWLFLIIVDIVFLCVCGFFLYKNLSARFFMPVEETEVVAEEQAAPQPDLLAEVLPEPKKETKAPAAPAVKADGPSGQKALGYDGRGDHYRPRTACGRY